MQSIMVQYPQMPSYQVLDFLQLQDTPGYTVMIAVLTISPVSLIDLWSYMSPDACSHSYLEKQLHLVHSLNMT